MGRRRTSFRFLLVVVALALLVWGGIASFRTGAPPELAIELGQPAIGRRTPVRVVAQEGGRGLGGLRLELVQGDRVELLAERGHEPLPPWRLWGPRRVRDELSTEVGRETLPSLKAGQATLRATATRAGTWLRSPAPVVRELNVPVRLAPPSLYVLSTQHYVSQGGAEVVVYKAGETSVEDGVRAGDWWFPGQPLPGGGPQDRFALFAVPYDLDDAVHVRLVALDDAGNKAEVAFVDKFFPQPVRKDTIEVTDAFLARVVPDIMSNTPDLQDRGSPLDNYLAINRELRGRNAEQLKRLGTRSAPRFLWSEAFLPVPGGQVMSAFADRRSYRYAGREIDRQDHLGFDLATTQQAPLPAANSGVVALAEYLGIYGNTVVIDHGFGLMTLYGHLSSIDVARGQEVARGQVIGRTGATGLAGGDHLHFTVLLHGLPILPTEWWDAHWIRDRLARKLGAAMAFKG
jgi:murein DD-endopeptidase MepM/ murein hydrolase activator NlpD